MIPKFGLALVWIITTLVRSQNWKKKNTDCGPCEPFWWPWSVTQIGEMSQHSMSCPFHKTLLGLISLAMRLFFLNIRPQFSPSPRHPPPPPPSLQPSGMSASVCVQLLYFCFLQVRESSKLKESTVSFLFRHSPFLPSCCSPVPPDGMGRCLCLCKPGTCTCVRSWPFVAYSRTSLCPGRVGRQRVGPFSPCRVLPSLARKSEPRLPLVPTLESLGL